ncbi:MAG: glycosyl transferase [Bacteroidetes bacterium]|nr:MAG: glycosyl transferase [Bacteroidota bacterium]
MKTAPILLFTYNRPRHTKNTIEALKRNKLADESELIIFSDASRNEKMEESVQKVRDYLRTIVGFKKIQIIEREKNYGLGNNIIDGVNCVVNQYGKVIVLEDDLLTAPYFLEFMNKSLSVYENSDDVISVHGFSYPVKQKLPETFFIRGADCLGWGTWKRAWKFFEPDGSKLLRKLMETKQTYHFDFNDSYPFTQMLKDQIAGKNNSWAVRWYASAFLENKYTLYPNKSLVYHAGNDGTGTNSGFDSVLNVQMSKSPIKVHPISIEENKSAFEAFAAFYRKLHRPGLFYKVKSKLKKIFWNGYNRLIQLFRNSK